MRPDLSRAFLLFGTVAGGLLVGSMIVIDCMYPTTDLRLLGWFAFGVVAASVLLSLATFKEEPCRPKS